MAVDTAKVSRPAVTSEASRRPSAPLGRAQNRWGRRGRPLAALTAAQRDLAGSCHWLVPLVFARHYGRRMPQFRQELLDAGELGLLKGAARWRRGVGHDDRPQAYLARAIRLQMAQCAAGLFRQKRRAERTTRPLTVADVEGFAADDGRPEAAAEADELLAAVCRLPEPLQAAVWLRFWGQAAYARIAERIRVSPGTARRLALDGVAALRRRYRDGEGRP